MNNNDLVKYLGILIALVMLVSFIGFGLLYGNNINTSAIDTSTEQLVDNKEEFSYNISFDTSALSEINALRLVASTTSIDKDEIDSLVSKVSGVSRVSSRLTKLADFEGWFYYAEVYLKKGVDSSIVAENILAIDLFSKDPSESQVVKYMTISAPASVKLFNPDSNISRDYNFESTTVSALVDLATLPGDKISVTGTIKLIGKTITGLELIEESNSTNTPTNYTVKQKLVLSELEEDIMFEGEREASSYLSQEDLKKEINLLDENASVFVYSFYNKINIETNSEVSEDLVSKLENVSGINSVTTEDKKNIVVDFNNELVSEIYPKIKSLVEQEDFSSKIVLPKEMAYGTTIISKSTDIQEILVQKGFSPIFVQSANFFLDKITIPELGEEFDFNSSFPARIKTNHKVGEEVELTLTISIQRGKIIQITGIEE
ncbi:MAG: hypothetical protein GX950_02225 [Candidatus Diapherotrites archaeon]|jgi:hypothetical protein|uniref:Uncharacterized protein n=1 Tax=Candidatus Iainarchaeum sp. TaxID=3101447 RepID=A0A7K4BZC2_9ARCH|nr:hypothetical protein [Candidatus Diapherotrites archaeon]